ncbi:unnamed protein product, partial [Didymodactylos carnosus]
DVYGIRLAQGHLFLPNDYLTKSNSQYTDDNLYIKTLADKIDLIANKSLAEVKINPFDYYNLFVLVVSKSFICEYKQRSTHEHLIRQDNLDSRFNENVSDECFAEVLGTISETNTKECIIDEHCWKMMTTDNP